jgi:peptide subunit release factor RF-3
VPIITFVNKLDREGRGPFDPVDEIEQSVALDVMPASWPIDTGRDFLAATGTSAQNCPRRLKPCPIISEDLPA